MYLTYLESEFCHTHLLLPNIDMTTTYVCMQNVKRL